MKQLLQLPVNHLRVYSSPIERTSAVSKTKSMKVGALILATTLPKTADGEDSGYNAIELTAKQLNNLCSIAKVQGTGESAWRDLSILVGTMESKAIVSITYHKKGDTYVDANGAEAQFTQDGANPTVDSIVLPASVTNAFRQAVIVKQLNWGAGVNELKDILDAEPVLEVK